MEPKLLKLKKNADNAYFNSDKPIMSDKAYDGLCDYLNSSINVSDEIGCLPVINKIELPVYMGSLTKYNTNEKIDKFIGKMNHKKYLIQEKLDGISCLYVPFGEQYKLYTRGDGTTGSDISHLLNCGLKIFDTSDKIPQFMVRGELIISKNIFKDKYSSSFKNIRNMVSGQIHAKNPIEDIVKHIDFVAYEVIINDKTQLSMVKQMMLLKESKFKVVHHRIIDQSLLNSEMLSEYLNYRKNKSKYEMDGLVLTSIKKYVRTNNSNPKHSFAFKIQGETKEVEVDYVKWNLSKSGKYKPQIFIKPVELGGVTISSLTGFNAKYIVTNKISKGAILLITRSGDVIPHIITVLKESEDDINLPCESKWNSVDLYHNLDHSPAEVIVKQMVYFFTSLKCLNCKDKTILKIYQSGFHSIESIISAKIEEFEKIEGVGRILATKLLTSIHEKIKEATLHELLAALNSFGEGIGLKKIQNINLSNPQDNLQIKGLSQHTITEKILPVFKSQMDRVLKIKELVGINYNLTEENKIEKKDDLPLQNKIFVFTGFRDTSLEKIIFSLGGKVTTTISKKTTDLVRSNIEHGKQSTKLIKAQELGINIITKSDLQLQLSNLVSIQPQIDYDSSDEEKLET